jgi:hypothetical protein
MAEAAVLPRVDAADLATWLAGYASATSPAAAVPPDLLREIAAIWPST